MTTRPSLPLEDALDWVQSGEPTGRLPTRVDPRTPPIRVRVLRTRPKATRGLGALMRTRSIPESPQNSRGVVATETLTQPYWSCISCTAAAQSRSSRGIILSSLPDPVLSPRMIPSRIRTWAWHSPILACPIIVYVRSRANPLRLHILVLAFIPRPPFHLLPNLCAADEDVVDGNVDQFDDISDEAHDQD